MNPLAGELASLHNAGVTNPELAKQFGLTVGQVKGYIRSYKVRGEFDVIHLGTPLDLQGDFIVVGDVHVTSTDWAWAHLVARVSEAKHIDRLIVGGDFLNFDMFSTFATAVHLPTWREERDAARELLSDWLETFSEIYFLFGNHERRLQKWSAGEFDEADIFGMLNTSNKIKVSNFGYCTVTSGGVGWRITHPRNYSRNRLMTAGELAVKFQTNVISFHEHHVGKAFDRWGRWVIVNGGSLADPDKMAYVKLEDNTMPAMSNGITVLESGCVTLLSKKPFTNWDEVLG